MRAANLGVDPFSDIDRMIRPVEYSAALSEDRAAVSTTDGNHGHALARMARLLGLPARVFIPSVVDKAAVDAIAGEGAIVTIVDADYDEAVRRAAEWANDFATRIIGRASWTQRPISNAGRSGKALSAPNSVRWRERHSTLRRKEAL
jgi:cysteine synthase